MIISKRGIIKILFGLSVIGLITVIGLTIASATDLITNILLICLI